MSKPHLRWDGKHWECAGGGSGCFATTLTAAYWAWANFRASLKVL